MATRLKEGVHDLGLELNPDEECWLPSLNAVRIPEDIDDGRLLSTLQEEYAIEIASGLGALEGDIVRIGCMGYSARRDTIEFVLAALEDALQQQR